MNTAKEILEVKLKEVVELFLLMLEPESAVSELIQLREKGALLADRNRVLEARNLHLEREVLRVKRNIHFAENKGVNGYSTHKRGMGTDITETSRIIRKRRPIRQRKSRNSSNNR